MRLACQGRLHNAHSLQFIYLQYLPFSKAPLPKPMPNYLRATYTGYASIVVLPISLMSSTIFSEAMWQRCWATANKRCGGRSLFAAQLN